MYWETTVQLITLGLFLQHLPNPVQQPVPYLQWKVVLLNCVGKKENSMLFIDYGETTWLDPDLSL